MPMLRAPRPSKKMCFAPPRKVLWLLAFAVLALANPVRAAWPDKTIRIVVPFAPGGGTDGIARTLAQQMMKGLAGSTIIENKPGAGTIIGTQSVAGSEPDG